MVSKKDPISLPIGEGRRFTGNIMAIDVHKDILAVCIVDNENILFEDEIKNNKEGIQKILRLFKKYEVESAAWESTSTYHFKLMFAFVENKKPHLVANPQQTKATQGKKTDKLDARRIAVAHRDGRLKPSLVSSRQICQMRKCTRKLYLLICEMTKTKQRIQQLFHQYDFTVHSRFSGFLNNKWSRNLITEIVLSDKTTNDLVEEYYPKRSGQSETRKTDLIQGLDALRNQLTPPDRLALFTEFQTLLNDSNFADLHRRMFIEIAKQNKKVRDFLRILLSIPGIGLDTAAVIISEIVDVEYFSSADKLSKWVGLAPRVMQSGHRKHITGRIHKGGNKHVRRALSIACSAIYARKDSEHPIYRFITEKYNTTGKYWLAICAGARKLLCIIHHLLKYNVEWTPKDLKDPQVILALKAKVSKKIDRLERDLARSVDLRKQVNKLYRCDISNFDENIQTELLRLLRTAS